MSQYSKTINSNNKNKTVGLINQTSISKMSRNNKTMTIIDNIATRSKGIEKKLVFDNLSFDGSLKISQKQNQSNININISCVLLKIMIRVRIIK